MTFIPTVTPVMFGNVMAGKPCKVLNIVKFKLISLVHKLQFIFRLNLEEEANRTTASFHDILGIQ